MEKLKTRQEIETPKPELLRAVEQLQKVGLLLPMKNQEIFHGRAGNGEKWKVVDDFDNAGNATGHQNVGKIPMLYTSDHDTARAFAIARARENYASQGEVHRITSNDEYASIIVPSFDFNALSETERRQTISSLRQTLPSPLEGSPISFRDRSKIARITMPREGGMYTDKGIKLYAQRNGVSEELAQQLCGAFNTRHLLFNHPSSISKMINALIKNWNTVTMPRGDGESISVPINREYLATWLHEIHAVGAKKDVVSATLGDKQITTFMMFDTGKINTAIENDKQRARRDQRLGKLAMILASRQEMAQAPKPFSETIENPYSSPREVIEAAKSVPGYKEIFEADAGNWEGFSLEEHTETTLRIFEYNYVDNVPTSLLPLVKLCLLVHDIGKPESVKKNDKKNQRSYNLKEAERFMTITGLDDRFKRLVLDIIGEGKTKLEDYLFGGREYHKFHEYRKTCLEIYERYSGEEPAGNEEIAISSVIMMLQICDSAAYTDAAITRMPTGPEGVYYRNAPSFNGSFRFGGTTHRGVKLKQK